MGGYNILTWVPMNSGNSVFLPAAARGTLSYPLKALGQGLLWRFSG